MGITWDLYEWDRYFLFQHRAASPWYLSSLAWFGNCWLIIKKHLNVSLPSCELPSVHLSIRRTSFEEGVEEGFLELEITRKLDLESPEGPFQLVITSKLRAKKYQRLEGMTWRKYEPFLHSSASQRGPRRPNLPSHRMWRSGTTLYRWTVCDRKLGAASEAHLHVWRYGFRSHGALSKLED